MVFSTPSQDFRLGTRMSHSAKTHQSTDIGIDAIGNGDSEVDIYIDTSYTDV